MSREGVFYFDVRSEGLEEVMSNIAVQVSDIRIVN